MRLRANELLIFAVLLHSLAAAAQQRSHLLPLSPAERAAVYEHFDRGLLPAGATHPNLDRQQSFKLVNRGVLELSVAAVDFSVPGANAGTPRHSCGVFVVPAHGATYFLGGGSSNEDLPIQCWKVYSIRLVPKVAAPPDIVFVGGDSLTSHSWLQAYVMSRTAHGPYQLSVDYKDAP
jgi:hypothetical protein